MHPAAHISTEVVCVLACSSNSGALYHSVTTLGVIGLRGSPNHLARPKSAIFTHPLSVIRRFETFKSLWTMKLWWRYLNPFNTWRTIHLTWLSEKGACILSNKLAKSCSQYSMARKILSRLLPTTTSFSWTIFSCLQDSNTLISLKPLTGKPSFSCSIRTFFKATTLSFFVSLARYTIP